MINKSAMKYAYIKYLYEECKREYDYPDKDIYREINAFLDTREGKNGLKLYIEKHNKALPGKEVDAKIAEVIRQLAEIERLKP